MPANKQKITPRALMELKMPGEVRVAPEGKRVAFSVSETDWDENRVVQQLSVIGTDGRAAARQVTRGKADASEPRWSPDGRWLAFLTAREDDAASDEYEDEEDAPRPQVWLLPMDGGGGEAEKLTDAPEGIGTYEWLPDSNGVVFLAREPRAAPLQTARSHRRERKDDAVVEREEKFRQQIWRIDLDDKKAKLLHPGDFGIGELAVAPNGQWVAYTTNYTGEENDYHLADVWTLQIATGATFQLTEGPGGKFHPLWTPDSQSVLFTRSLNPALSFSQENLYQVRLSDRSMICLTENLPYDLTGWHGIWYDDQETLYVAAAVGTRTGLFIQSNTGDLTFETYFLEDQHIHEFHVGRNGELAFVASSPTQAPEVLWLAPDATGPLPLTNLNEDWINRYALAETRLVSYEAPDGLWIEALLTLPSEYDPRRTFPLIVNVHGGPHGRAVQALTPFSVAQVWASEGYLVLSPNYRGSEGYGEEFGTASRGDLGGGDYQDVLAAATWAVHEGLADGNRMGMIGSSYGAYLVNWAVTRTTQFQAAVSQFGIFSLATDFSNSQAPRWDVEYLGGFPWDTPEAYARLSPASQVSQAQTPVLIMHGEGDPNTFIANSQEMYQALRLLGRTVEFVRYPREGHGFFEPQHRLDEMRRVLAWFDRYVRDAGERTEYRLNERIIRDGWELIITEASRARYRGQSGKARYLEVVFSLRDVQERHCPLLLKQSDVTLTPIRTGRPTRAAGLPVEALGGKALVQTRAWRFAFTPDTEERSLAVALAVAFPIGQRGGTYQFTVSGFPPVVFDVPVDEGAGE